MNTATTSVPATLRGISRWSRAAVAASVTTVLISGSAPRLLGIDPSAGIAQGRQPEPADALRGPKVGVEKPRHSLIDRDFNGALRPPEPSPEAAAFELLTLPPDQAAAIRERSKSIFAARARLMDEFCAANLDLIVKFGNAAGAGDQGEVLTLLMDALRKLKPLRDRGTLESELIDILPSTEQKAFRALLKEYRDAVVADARSESERRGEKPKGRMGILAESGLKQLGNDIKISVERQFKNGEFAFRYLTQGLSLNPEQENSIREKVRLYVERVGEQEIKAEQVKLFFEISKELTPEQRKVFARRLIKGDRSAMMAAKKPDREGPATDNEKDDDPGTEPTGK